MCTSVPVTDSEVLGSENVTVYSLPFPSSTTFTWVEDDGCFAYYTLSYHSKEHFRLILDFYRSLSDFFQGGLPVFLYGLICHDELQITIWKILKDKIPGRLSNVSFLIPFILLSSVQIKMCLLLAGKGADGIKPFVPCRWDKAFLYQPVKQTGQINQMWSIQ